jgi:hypothetical protein
MRRAAFLFMLVSSVALACSGPGAAAVMERSTLIGWGCVFVSIGFTVALSARAFRSKSNLFRGAALIAILLCVIHPGIWTSAYIGDCGSSRTIGRLAGEL